MGSGCINECKVQDSSTLICHINVDNITKFNLFFYRYGSNKMVSTPRWEAQRSYMIDNHS